MGGAHTAFYVKVKKNGLDRYKVENVTYKYSKCPAWMFWGTIVGGRKGLSIFWEKEWGTMNSARYNTYILSQLQEYMAANPGLVFMHDNAPCHRSAETQWNLRLRGIPIVKWPRYSPDLNIIEHVWNWMKNWIQEHYFKVRYNSASIQLEALRGIIQEAWEAVPESYIVTLLDSWWERCDAVIKAHGGPTKY
jgi:transposase